MTENPWYASGLRFKCTECGQCCTGAPGYIWITDEEAKTISDHLAISLDEFFANYTYTVGSRRSLKELPDRNYDCIFLNGKKCQIYSLRPKQCRTFPWWLQNLESEEEWKETAKHCEGIDHPDAPLISLDSIRKNLR